MEKKLIIGQKYLDLQDGREYELVGIKDKKTAILIRGVARQEINLEDFWKVFKSV